MVGTVFVLQAQIDILMKCLWKDKLEDNCFCMYVTPVFQIFSIKTFEK